MTNYVVVAETIHGEYKVLVRPHTDMYDSEFRSPINLKRRPKIYKTLEGAKWRCEKEEWYFVSRKIYPRLFVCIWIYNAIGKKVWESE